MKRFLSLLFFVSLIIIITFLLFSDFENTIQIWVNSAGSVWTYSAISFGLLAGDVLLPVPSSLLMILNGKVLGVFAGASLSLVAGMTASLIGFYLGHKSTSFVNRFFSEKDIAAGNRFFNRFGSFSIAISKFIPILSETISFISGCSDISLKNFLVNSLTGHLLIAVIYAFIGHFAVAYNSNVLAGIVIGSVLLTTWVLGMIGKRKKESDGNLTGIKLKNN